jgi:predicted esterase
MIVGLHYASPTPGLSPYFGLGYVGQLVLPALKELNALLVAPDAPDATWTSVISERLILAVIGEVKKENPIDAKRTLVTGFSMGGAGTWMMASKHGDLVRGGIVVAAAPPPADSKPVVPMYVIHSRKDESQPFDITEKAVRALEASGANVTFAPVDDLPHRDTSQYVEPLAGAISWIQETWTEG